MRKRKQFLPDNLAETVRKMLTPSECSEYRSFERLDYFAATKTNPTPYLKLIWDRDSTKQLVSSTSLEKAASAYLV